MMARAMRSHGPRLASRIAGLCWQWNHFCIIFSAKIVSAQPCDGHLSTLTPAHWRAADTRVLMSSGPHLPGSEKWSRHWRAAHRMRELTSATERRDGMRPNASAHRDRHSLLSAGQSRWHVANVRQDGSREHVITSFVQRCSSHIRLDSGVARTSTSAHTMSAHPGILKGGGGTAAQSDKATRWACVACGVGRRSQTPRKPKNCCCSPSFVSHNHALYNQVKSRGLNYHGVLLLLLGRGRPDGCRHGELHADSCFAGQSGLGCQGGWVSLQRTTCDRCLFIESHQRMRTLVTL